MVKKGKLHLSYKLFLTKLQIQHEKYQNDKYLEHSYLKDKKMEYRTKDKFEFHFMLCIKNN